MISFGASVALWLAGSFNNVEPVECDFLFRVLITNHTPHRQHKSIPIIIQLLSNSYSYPYSYSYSYPAPYDRQSYMYYRWEAGGGGLLMSDTLYLHSTAVSNVSCSPVNLPREPTLAASSLEEPRAFDSLFFCFFLIYAQSVLMFMLMFL